MRLGNYILTYTDTEFWPLDPRIDEIKTQDIGHALSLLCRGNGHVNHFYSVGQHSLCCAKEAKVRGYSTRVQLACLMHDGSEAYLSDITRPVKKDLGRYMEIEEKLQTKIYEAYGLSDLTEDELNKMKLVDDAVLKAEMKELMNFDGIVAEDLVGNYDLSFRMMSEVEKEFIDLTYILSFAVMQEASK
ncbi:MAG: HD domain-containing protein [Clostridium sp.]